MKFALEDKRVRLGLLTVCGLALFLVLITVLFYQPTDSERETEPQSAGLDFVMVAKTAEEAQRSGGQQPDRMQPAANQLSQQNGFTDNIDKAKPIELTPVPGLTVNQPAENISKPEITLDIKAESAPEAAADLKTGMQTALEEGWSVQAGSFTKLSNAERMQRQLEQHGYQAICKTNASGKMIRVIAGVFPTRQEALTCQQRLLQELRIQAIVVRNK